MSIENVRKFEERIGGDEALQARLKELTDAFDGDKEDARAIFEAIVAPLAAEAGLPYTYDEALEYVDQKDDDEDLSAADLKAAAGGRWVSHNCFTLGFGEPDATACSGGEKYGANACAYIGVGFVTT